MRSNSQLVLFDRPSRPIGRGTSSPQTVFRCGPGLIASKNGTSKRRIRSLACHADGRRCSSFVARPIV